MHEDIVNRIILSFEEHPLLRNHFAFFYRQSSEPRERLANLYHTVSSMSPLEGYTLFQVYDVITRMIQGHISSAEVFIQQVSQENQDRYLGRLDELVSYSTFEGFFRFLNIASALAGSGAVVTTPTQFLSDFLLRYHKHFRHGRRRAVALKRMNWDEQTMQQRKLAFRNFLQGRDLLSGTGLQPTRQNIHRIRVLLGLMCFLYIPEDVLLSNIPEPINNIARTLFDHLHRHHGNVEPFCGAIEGVKEAYCFFMERADAYFSLVYLNTHR